MGHMNQLRRAHLVPWRVPRERSARACQGLCTEPRASTFGLVRCGKSLIFMGQGDVVHRTIDLALPDPGGLGIVGTLLFVRRDFTPAVTRR